MSPIIEEKTLLTLHKFFNLILHKGSMPSGLICSAYVNPMVCLTLPLSREPKKSRIMGDVLQTHWGHILLR
jgi:hypothetical protein